MKRIAILLAVAALGAAFSLMAGGFLYGVIHAEGGNSLASFPGRLFVGLVFAFLNVIFMGFPPTDSGGASFYNTWLYVGPIMALLVPLSLFVTYVELQHRGTDVASREEESDTKPMQRED